MLTVINEYNKHKEEVLKYFELVSFIDKVESTLTCSGLDDNVQTFNVDAILPKILKANCFLILYNLIESTMTNLIKAITNHITSENLTYGQLSSRIRKLWVDELTNAKTVNCSSCAYNITEIVDMEKPIKISPNGIKISGNIDAQMIRKIAEKLGWKTSKNGEDLVIIKRKRNSLSHGDFTFTDIGKDKSMQDIERYKEQTFNYLNDVIIEVENFITQKKYMKSDMRIIALKGARATGKTTTIELVYDKLIVNSKVIFQKEQKGRNSHDFSCVLKYNDTYIDICSIGNYIKTIKKNIENSNKHFDVLICVVNEDKYYGVSDVLNTYSSFIIDKTIDTTDNAKANENDANVILQELYKYV